MRFEVERQKEGLQRALAATEGQLSVAQARLQDLTSDNEVQPALIGLRIAAFWTDCRYLLLIAALSVRMIRQRIWQQ